VDAKAVPIPAGVEIDEILVDPNTRVKQGDVLATVDMATVMTALADVQGQIEKKDQELSDASAKAATTSVKAGVSGRVKVIYAQPGDDIASCMVEHGALALISQDKYMSFSIDCGSLKAGDTVTVVREDGSTLSGKVDSVSRGKAVILVTDKGTLPDEPVSVRDGDGQLLGSGELAIHNPIKVVGYTGTISSVLVREDQQVYAESSLFRIKDASSAAGVSSILKERQTLEDTLLSLLTIYQDGAVRAPFDGTVLSLDDGNGSQTAPSQSMTVDFPSSFYSFPFASQMAGMSPSSAGDAASASAPAGDTGETTVVTLSRDEEMSVTISVDETDILALDVGQPAELTIESIGKDTYSGTITGIDRTASTGSGVTSYSATSTFSKGEFMLGGMTADVVITISGTENVLMVPTDAVNRTSASAYVYTAYDEKTGQFFQPVTVSLGVSNKEYTEIRSGLQEGDTVCYTKARNPFWMYGFGMDSPYGG
jgi:multidrug efflux pump subunit AcrA (membrane-fusion protein)